MSFTFTDEPTFEWPVRVSVPQGDGGFIGHEFKATFLEVPEDEFFEAHDGETIVERIASDRAFLSRVWLSWRGINLPDGAPLEVTDENRRRLLSQRTIRMAVGQAYKQAYIDGNVRAGNSAARLA